MTHEQLVEIGDLLRVVNLALGSGAVGLALLSAKYRWHDGPTRNLCLSYGLILALSMLETFNNIHEPVSIRGFALLAVYGLGIVAMRQMMKSSHPAFPRGD